MYFLDFFFLDPDPDFPDRFQIFGQSGLRKKVRSGSRNKTGIQNTALDQRRKTGEVRHETGDMRQET